MAPTNRIRQAEQELAALSLLIDGRHARDGQLTWTMIRQTVDGCWRLLAADRNGHPDHHHLVTPVQRHHARERELAQIAELAGQLAGRLDLLTRESGRVGGLSRMRIRRTRSWVLCRVGRPSQAGTVAAALEPLTRRFTVRELRDGLEALERRKAKTEAAEA